MKIWIDAQLPPTLASWVTNTFVIEALSLRDIGLRDPKDIEIFEAARIANIIIMTKDSDFVDLVCRLLLLEAEPLISHSHAEHGNEINEINERTMGNRVFFNLCVHRSLIKEREARDKMNAQCPLLQNSNHVQEAVTGNQLND